MPETISDSEFHIWRALFALAHADGEVTPEEAAFMRKALELVSLDDDRRFILERDIETAADIGEMFAGITDQNDRVTFFHYARLLVWCDGDFDAQEQKILTELRTSHIKKVDFGALVKDSGLSFEGDEQEDDLSRHHKELEEIGRKGIFHALANRLISH